jgi:alpha-N-arabinofuranosidase
MMKQAGMRMNGLSLHYYTNFRKVEAAGISEENYRAIIEKAYRVEELVRTNCGIMDRYDPDKRVGLIVDEWGTWYKVEPGTNPGFLYQQNTVCDAVVAGMTLNIFNKYCDRVQMANIAQLVNVLQAMILTDGADMLLTPTYHVFKMYAEHQENTLLGSFITSNASFEDAKTPQLIESASVREDGTIISTIVNTSATDSAEIHCQIADFKVGGIKAEILTGRFNAHNTFEEKETVKACPFDAFVQTADGFTATLPPCSVVKFEIN